MLSTSRSLLFSTSHDTSISSSRPKESFSQGAKFLLPYAMPPSSILGVSPWRKRAYSLQSQQDDLPRDVGEASSPPSTSVLPMAFPRQLSSSVSSATGHREPIRSFIHGSIRDHFGIVRYCPCLPRDTDLWISSNRQCTERPIRSRRYRRARPLRPLRPPRETRSVPTAIEIFCPRRVCASR